MKILQVSNYKPTIFGGLEAVVYHLSSTLSNMDHNVTVISSTNNKSLKNSKVSNFKIIEIPSFILNYRLIIPRNIIEIINQIKTNDVIHIHSPNLSFALLIGYLSIMLRKPIIVTVLTFFDGLSQPIFGLKIINLLVDLLVGLLAKLSNKVHVLNEADYRKIRYFNKKVIYIPNGLPEYYFSDKFNPDLFFSKYKLRDKKLILYVGRIDPLKGPQIFIEAINMLVKKNDNIHGVIVGSKNVYYNYIEKLIKKYELENNITLTGRIDEKMKISAYDASSVVVIPSCYDFVEAFSIVASEAWARHKPVVGSDIGALRFRIKPNENGFTAKANHPESFAYSIHNSLSLKAIKIPKDVCDWREIATQYENIYYEILK